MDTSMLINEVKSICEKLESLGENSLFISVNLSSNTSTYHGSSLGLQFILQRLHLIEEFFKHCECDATNSNFTILSEDKRIDKKDTKETETEIPEKENMLKSQLKSVSKSNNDTIEINCGTNSGTIKHKPESTQKLLDEKDKDYIDDIDYNLYSPCNGIDENRQNANDKDQETKICDNTCLSKVMHENFTTTDNVNFNGDIESNPDKEKNYSVTMEVSVRNDTDQLCDKIKSDAIQTVKESTIPKGRYSLRKRTISVIDKLKHSIGKDEIIPDIKRNLGMKSQKQSKTITNMTSEKLSENDNLVIKKRGKKAISSKQDSEIDNLVLKKRGKEAISSKQDKEILEKKAKKDEIEAGKKNESDEDTQHYFYVNKMVAKKRKSSRTVKIGEREKAQKSGKIDKLMSAKGESERTELDIGTKYSANNKHMSGKLTTKKNKPKVVDPTSPYFCSICQLTLSKSWFASHMRDHKRKEAGNWLVTCAVCGEGFMSVIRLRVHLSFKHDFKNVFKCENCHERFASKTAFRQHQPACKNKILNIESDENEIKCSLCLEEFENNDELKEHIHLHKIHSSLKCEFCDKVFATVFKLRKHKIKHSIMATEYKCVKCPRVFAKPHLLKSHLKVYHKEDQHVCKICCRLFPTHDLLQEHWRTHNPYDDSTCKKCWEKFSDKETLKEHMKTHEDILRRLQRHKCDQCGKRFHEMRKYKAHLLTHKDETPFACDKCDAKYKNRDTLRKHKLRTHAKLKFMCDICGSVYSCKETLVHHKGMVHAEKRIHECEHCGRKFRTLSSHHQHLLDNHCTPENVHEMTNFKVHKCQYCPKMFVIKHLWKDHMNGHTGSHPYVCEICHAKYTNRHNYRCHMMTHKTRKFKCVVCDYAFITHAKYREHVRSRKHKNNLEKAGMVDENVEIRNDDSEIETKISNDHADISNGIETKVEVPCRTISGHDFDRSNDFSPIQPTQMNELLEGNQEELKLKRENQIVEEIDNQQYVEISNIGDGDVILENNSNIIDIHGSLLDAENVVLVVTNGSDVGSVGDYILQGYEASTSEAVVQAIINQELSNIK